MGSEAAETGMSYSKECLYDVDWQKRRLTFKGKWSTDNGVRQALAGINAYWATSNLPQVDGIDTSFVGKAERIWRCLNLLNAVKLGWSQNPTGCPSGAAMDKVIELSFYLSSVHGRPSMQMQTSWDWNKVRMDLMPVDKRDLKLIQTDLQLRAKHAKRLRPQEGDDGVRKRRPELCFFLDLISAEFNRREGNPTNILAKVKEVRSPYQGVFRGYRIICAVSNMAGLKPFTSESAPSFDRPYHVDSFGDFEDGAALEKAQAAVVAVMTNRGFGRVDWIIPE